MPIEYCDSNMPTTKEDAPGNDEYLCIFPSMGIKKAGQYETWLANLYARCSHADYYKQYSSTGKRATPGTFAKHAPTRDAPGIINMYTKVYPGNKTFPSDNSALRIKNFHDVFASLTDQHGIGKLHIMIPSKIQCEQQQYLQYMEDYLSTCKLHGSDPTIYVYGCTEPIQKAEQTTGPVKPRIQTSKITAKPRPKQVEPVAPTTAAPVYKLDVSQTQITYPELILYEVDFVKGQIQNTDSMDRGVLRYFNDSDGRWARILDDIKLRKEAQKVYDKIGDIIGNDNVFPPTDQIFNAFQYLKAEPKVVIIGQDPYHKKGQAHGLSFSVMKGVTVPPSLKNIYSALENDPDIEFKRPAHGCLEEWAHQGVIMLNASLTVMEGDAGSHKNIWQSFTDRLIELLSTKYPGLIYVLWGGDAKAKKGLIGDHSVILEYNHPSPLARIGNRPNTFGTECRHFSQINTHLVRLGKEPITWQLGN